LFHGFQQNDGFLTKFFIFFLWHPEEEKVAKRKRVRTTMCGSEDKGQKKSHIPIEPDSTFLALATLWLGHGSPCWHNIFKLHLTRTGQAGTQNHD
jgi:hypothetical protein